MPVDAPPGMDRHDHVVDGLTVATWTAGRRDRPALVLVHGFASSSAFFAGVAERFAEHFYVVAVDLPGFGHSQRPDKLTISGLAATLAGVIAKAGLRRPVVLANSMGCQVTVQLAADRAVDLDRLVLSGPTLDPNSRNMVRLLARALKTVPREPARLLVQVAREALHDGIGTLWAGMRAMTRDDVEAVASRVRVPSLIIRGSRDPICPASFAHRLATILSDAQVLTVDGASHTAGYVLPDGFVDAVCAFVDSGRRPPSVIEEDRKP